MGALELSVIESRDCGNKPKGLLAFFIFVLPSDDNFDSRKSNSE
jgi:hypothetical protein